MSHRAKTLRVVPWVLATVSALVVSFGLGPVFSWSDWIVAAWIVFLVVNAAVLLDVLGSTRNEP